MCKLSDNPALTASHKCCFLMCTVCWSWFPHSAKKQWHVIHGQGLQSGQGVPVQCDGKYTSDDLVRLGDLGNNWERWQKCLQKCVVKQWVKLQYMVCKPLFFLFWWCCVIQQGVSSPSVPFRHSDQANRSITLKACTGWILGRYCLPWTCPHSSSQPAETSQPPAAWAYGTRNNAGSGLDMLDVESLFRAPLELKGYRSE